MKKGEPATLIATAYREDQLLSLQEASVLFVGRSNAGKSSLLNSLAKTGLARIAKSPGKTRSVNYYRFSPGIVLVDLPGYGYARLSREEKASWQELLFAFFETTGPKTQALLLMDGKRALEEEELDLLGAFSDRGIPCRVLFTKADRLNQAERSLCIKRFGERTASYRGIPLTYGFVSAKTGEGVDALRRTMLKYAQETDF